MAVGWVRKYNFLVLVCWIVAVITPGIAQIEDVAKGRGVYATQLGIYRNYTADKALDGDPNANVTAGHCAQPHGDSGSGDKAWWMVDLGSSHAIYNVTIYSEDSTSNQVVLGYISVRVSDSADISEHTDQCALWDKREFPKDSHETLVCKQVMYGRYVSIQRTGGNHTYQMILCEVMVMGKPVECEAHKYGINCQQECSSRCKGDECDSKTGHCQLCDSGYYGDKCEHECNTHCKDGICNKDTGNCECESGYYGDDCDQCSEGCEDTCNSDSGRCSCKDWWDGSKCDTVVGFHKIPRYVVTLTGMTDSSVVVTWRTIRNLPDNMKQYYSYVLEYRLDGESEWTVVDRKFQHEPGADGTQQYTLTGLQYNTAYEAQVWSVRSLRGLTERTEDTPDAQFSTTCKVPDKPTNVEITHEQANDKVNLVVTWTKPDSRCDRISDNDLDYRLSLGSEDDWTNKDLGSGATSAKIFDLDPGEYLVRLTVTNNEGLTRSDTKTYYAFLKNDTDCDKCDDADCVKTAPCQTCKAGYKPLECKQICDSGDYGVNCAEDCSKGCQGTTCDHVLGTCSCRPWWTGDKCPAEIEAKTFLQEDPAATSLTDSSAVIQWKKIANVPAGLSDHYRYVIEYKEETSSSWVVWQTRPIHDPSSDQYQEATLTGLMYNTVYDVRVKSFRVLGEDREETGVTGENKFQTECTVPSKPLNVSVTSQDTDSKLTLSITWEPPNEVGCNKILGYSVLYRLKSAPSNTWVTDASLSSSTSHTLELGPGDYVVRIEVTNDGNSSDSTSYAEVTPHSEPSESSDGDGIGLIAGLVVGILVLVILLGVLGFIMYRRRQPGIFFGRRKGRPRDIVLAEHLELPEKDPSDTDSYEGIKEETQPSSNTKKIPLLPISLNSLASRIGKLRPGSAKAGPSKPPIAKKPDIAPVDDEEEETAVQIGDSRIRLENLAAYIKNKENETDGFKNEYSVLKKDLQHPCVEGEKEEHRIEKNRYRNIIAYDHARVVLGLWEGDPNSSYVNASYISGYGNVQREYVAAQGPKPETKEDFWRMMWLLNSNCIVMVTMTVENGRDKCVQYWPGKSEGVCQYADIKVETRQEETFADYVVRIFEIEKEGETRTIHQFHFTSWIDRSAPEHIFPLLHFRRKVMAFNDRRTGPLVVHCSAGVGRTGTFIAIDYLDKQAQAKHYVDVRSCVQELRTQRPNMVQTLPQYVFVYKSILELFEIGNTAIPCDQLADKYEELRSDGSAYANTTKLREQFELLNEQRIVPDDDEVAALSAENKTKNRCLNIVPSDRYRPYLSTWQGQSDYVNAVYIDSYRKRDMYIVTQTPMPETLTDFWRLVFEHNCNTIIMMENVDDSDQTVATYWPELVGTKQENGPLTIELLGEDTSGQPGLVSRDFIVAPTRRATRRPAKVKQFQLTAWDADDQLTANLQKELLNLIEKVDAWQAQAPKGPILIHCVNGASRSGLFCAANYLIDMIRTEQEVDVFYVVRHIRAHRPQLVDGLEQYQFLHELALTYMTQYATYSNYTGGT